MGDVDALAARLRAELEPAISRAVAEAVRPLHARLDALSGELAEATAALTAASGAAALEHSGELHLNAYGELRSPTTQALQSAKSFTTGVGTHALRRTATLTADMLKLAGAPPVSQGRESPGSEGRPATASPSKARPPLTPSPARAEPKSVSAGASPAAPSMRRELDDVGVPVAVEETEEEPRPPPLVIEPAIVSSRGPLPPIRGAAAPPPDSPGATLQKLASMGGGTSSRVLPDDVRESEDAGPGIKPVPIAAASRRASADVLIEEARALELRHSDPDPAARLAAVLLASHEIKDAGAFARFHDAATAVALRSSLEHWQGVLRRRSEPPLARFRAAVRVVVRLNRLAALGVAADRVDSGPKRRPSIGGSRRGRRDSRDLSGQSGTNVLSAYLEEIANVYAYTAQRVAPASDAVPGHLLLPESRRRLAWELLVMALALFYAVAVPLRWAFERPPEGGLLALDRFADVVFLADVGLNFNTAYRDASALVTAPALIARRYARSWFLLDFTASVPLTLVLGAGAAEARLRPLVYVLQLLRLARLERYRRHLEGGLSLNPGILRFGGSLLTLFTAWHLISCVYWALSSFEYGGTVPCADAPAARCWRDECIFYGTCSSASSLDDGLLTVTSSMRTVDTWIPHPDMARASFDAQYMTALFWAVQVTTGMGGDVLPANTRETVVTVIFTVLGMVLTALIIGSASSALASLDTIKAQQNLKMDRVKAYLRWRKVPDFFSKIIVDFYQHRFDTQAAEDDCLDELPDTLRLRLALVLNKNLVENVPYFQAFSAGTFIRLMHAMVALTYLPGEYIVRAGDSGSSMFIIRSGRVDVSLPGQPNSVVATLQPGQFFGEAALLSENGVRNASCRAVDYVDVLVLERADYLSIVSNEAGDEGIERFKRALHDTMQQRVAENNRRSQRALQAEAATATRVTSPKAGGSSSAKVFVS